MRARLAASVAVAVVVGGVLVCGPLAPVASAIEIRPGDTTGRIVDAAGNPRAGCALGLIDSQRLDFRTATLSSWSADGQPEPHTLKPPPIASYLRTDTDGRFAAPLLPGSYTLSAGCDFVPPFEYGTVHVPLGGVDLGDVWPMAPPDPPEPTPEPARYPVTGTVTSAADVSLRGTIIEILAADGTEVDGAGFGFGEGPTFAMSAPAGTYRVLVLPNSVRGLAPVMGEITVGASGAQYDVVLQPGVTVSGTISRDGVPLVNASVSLVPSAYPGVRQLERRVRSDADGGYSFMGVGPGRYELQVSDGVGDETDWAAVVPPLTRVVMVPDGQSPVVADVAMMSGGTVTGRVVDGAGRPQGGVLVVVWSSDGRNLARVTAADGTFSFTPMLGATFVVQVNSNVSFSGLTGRYYAGSGQLGAATRTGAAIVTAEASVRQLGDTVLDGCGTVSGSVTNWDILDSRFDKYYFPASVDVAVFRPGGPPARLGLVREDGSFEVSGLLPGSYYVALELRAGATTGENAVLNTQRYLWGADPWMGAEPVLTIGAGCSAVRGLTFDTTPVEDGDARAVTPTRLADLSVLDGVRTARCVEVATAGVPAGVSGVLVNVTSVSPQGVGNVVAFPSDGTAAPEAPPGSSVNFDVGHDVANAAFVGVGPDGKICLAAQSTASSRVLVDVEGFVMPDSGVVLQPSTRLADTRSPSRVGTLAALPRGEVVELLVAGQGGVPADAKAVLLNATVVNPQSPGNLRVYPADGLTTPPGVSTVNYVAGQTKASAAVVPLGVGGRIALYSDAMSNGAVDVVLDVTGYVTAGSTTYEAVKPQRVLDTRADAPAGLQRLTTLRAGTVGTLDLREATAVPAGARAALLSIVAIQPTTVGNLRVYADTGGPVTPGAPGASAVNYVVGRDIPNLVVVPIPVGGLVDFYDDQHPGGQVDLAVDVVGYLVAG